MITAERRLLVECYWPGIDEVALADAARRIDHAIADLRLVTDVSHIAAILMPADETVFWLFRGCEETVRMVSRRAGLPFERVVEYRWLDRWARPPAPAPVQGKP